MVGVAFPVVWDAFPATERHALSFYMMAVRCACDGLLPHGFCDWR